MNTSPALLQRLRRFAGDTRAVAAVEFALILPPLLLLFLGSIEGSTLITVDRRVQIVSGTVGDLVARWDPEAGTIPSATMTDYINASQTIMYPYEIDDMAQTITLVEVEDDEAPVVVWSCGYGGAVPHEADDGYELPDEMQSLVENTSGYVVVSEAGYAYTPVLGIVFEEIYNLYSRSFYLPRYELPISASC